MRIPKRFGWCRTRRTRDMMRVGEYGEDGIHTEGKLLMLNPMTDGMSVYCSCGRIVSLDRAEMETKIILGKNLECCTCRNVRIGREIDLLNSIFAGTADIDGGIVEEQIL